MALVPTDIRYAMRRWAARPGLAVTVVLIDRFTSDATRSDPGRRRVRATHAVGEVGRGLDGNG